VKPPGSWKKYRDGQDLRTVDPMVFFTLAWLYGKTGDTGKMNTALDAAAAQPTDYCFPYMNSSIAILGKSH